AALPPGGTTFFLWQVEERWKVAGRFSGRSRFVNESWKGVRHPNFVFTLPIFPRFALAFDRLLRADRLCHGIKERKASIVFQVAQDPDGQSQKEIKRNGAVRELKCGLYAREQQSQNKV